MKLKLKENPVCSDCIHVVITYDMVDDYGRRQYDIQEEFDGTELELRDFIRDIKIKGACHIEVIGEPGIYYESKKLKENSLTEREKIASNIERSRRNLREEKYDLSWKEHDVKIRVNGEMGIYPSYTKRIGDLVVNIDPEVFDNGEFGYTVYYTPDMGHAGFKKAESGFMNSSEAMDYADVYIFGATDWFGSFYENKSRTRQTSLKEQDVEIEVKHEGILEVPEGKNVDDLPISHFEKLAKKKGLEKITKALNNLQVWNKKKNPSLSTWAGDMIDKLTKKFGKNESVLRKRFNEGWYNGDAIITFSHNDDLEADLEEFLFDLFRDNPDVFDFDWPNEVTKLYLACNKDDYDYIKWFIEDWKYKHRDEYDESLIRESGRYNYYDTPDNEYGMFTRNDLPTEEDDWWASIPSDLRAIVHEMEETGWEGVGFTTTGVEYCISKQDRNRPELSYEMCVNIYDTDNSVSLSKYVDIYDWDKEKEISRIPNSSGISMFRTKEDVRRFARWFNQLGNSGIAKESVRISRKRKFNESIPEYIKAHTYDQLLKKLKELGFDISSKSARGVQKDKKIQMYKDGKNYEVKYFINMAQDFALRTSGISEI